MHSLFRTLLLAPLLLAACTLPGEREMEENALTLSPSGQLRLSANRLVPTVKTETLEFAPGATRLLTPAPLAQFQDQGVQNVHILTPAHDALRDSRVLALTRLVRGLGVESTRISAHSAEELSANLYRIEVRQTEVISPDCPNWGSDSAHSYANRSFSQMGCTGVTNLGAMLRHPEDIERGQGDSRPDATRSSAAVQQYRAPAAAASSAPAGGSGAAAPAAAAPASTPNSAAK